MPFRKYARKAYGTLKRAAKKRYGFNKKSKSVKFGKMASDVMMLKNIINSEKKTFQQTYSGILVGQVNVNATGATCTDITPLITQGAAFDQRNGKSVKLTSALYQFQVSQMGGLTVANRIIIEFWINKATTLATTTLLPYTFQNATFSGVIDANSPRDQDHFSEYQLIRRIERKITNDQITGEQQTITFDVPVKYNRGKGHHLRLGGDSGNPLNDVLNGQMFMTMRLEQGNSNVSTPSTKDVPITIANSGVAVRFAYRVWYYDN